MAKPSKTLNGVKRLESRPKLSRQGNGRNSKPSHGRKKLRGQGKG